MKSDRQVRCCHIEVSFKEISCSCRVDAKRISKRSCKEAEMERKDYEIRHDQIKLLAERRDNPTTWNSQEVSDR